MLATVDLLQELGLDLPGFAVGPLGLSRDLAADLWFLVPLAGLEPATCWSGDGSAQTLCSTANVLVTSDRANVIVSSNRRAVSRYPARTPSVASGHVHTRARRRMVAVGRSLSLGDGVVQLAGPQARVTTLTIFPGT